MSDREKRDIVLTPENYAYMQEVTQGLIKTHVGPSVINQTAQDRPVRYDPDTGEFTECNRLEQAICKAPVVPEGFYLVLKNPAVEEGEEHPPPGSGGKNSPQLRIGQRVNIPGPCMFALWPGQDANVIRGHHLRSNQYLLVRVYNEEEARANWSSAVMKKTSEAEGSDESGVLSTELPDDLTVGKQLVIKGTEVSFYIPPTGISVVPEGRKYVRDALTLERLEYCILVDENGNKRYERGPQVVFPQPTEAFVKGKKDIIKFRAIELNEIQGLHIKVIAPYVDESGKQRATGDELFITGKQQAIYFPREEHSIIRYDGKSKHFATAIPHGEGRYVMNRITGEITTVNGPAMLLPDPRYEVIVRRVLSQSQCARWYPGNYKVAEYNQHLESLLSNAPTTRAGAISEGDFGRGTSKKSKMARYAPPTADSLMNVSNQNSDQSVMGEEFTRGSTYTEPRTVTLDTKLQGVPTLEVWNGYAVMIRSKKGDRQVIQGPATILLDYDQSLEVFELSTGKPKTTDNLLKEVYLRVKNNWITDIIQVETSDHVKVQTKIQLRGDFTGDNPEKWFDAENYIKQTCDHVRSVLKGKVRQSTIANFHMTPEDFVRDAILGTKPEADGHRPGMMFNQFGFHITDVEILEVTIKDASIRNMLEESQHDVVATNLTLAKDRRFLSAVKEQEAIRQETKKVQQATKLLELKIEEDFQRITHEAGVNDDQRKAARLQYQLEQEAMEAQAKIDSEIKSLEPAMARENYKIEKSEAHQKLTLERLQAETAAVVSRANALSPELAVAIQNLSDTKRQSDLLANFGEMAAIKGIGTIAAAKQVLDFLPEGSLQKIKTGSE
jgi:major vault protein